MSEELRLCGASLDERTDWTSCLLDIGHPGTCQPTRQASRSSVPEAARAAKDDLRARVAAYVDSASIVTRLLYSAEKYADARVAAASVELQQEVGRLSAECEALRGTVAEERATTEWQPGRWWTVLDKDGEVWCETSDEDEARRSMKMRLGPEPYTLHRQWVTVQRSELRPVRAALASPGEGK